LSELSASVTKSKLATVSGPANSTVVIAASANQYLATVARIAVAVFIAILAFVVAESGLVVTADAVDDEVAHCDVEIGKGLSTIDVNVEVEAEQLNKTFVVERPATFSLIGQTASARENVAPSSLTAEGIGRGVGHIL